MRRSETIAQLVFEQRIKYDKAMNEEIDILKLKEFDSVQIKNPTTEKFGWRFNGELYEIEAGEIKSFSRNIAVHLAKHLSTQMIISERMKKATKKELDDPKSRIHSEISQIHIYNTPVRRIALYRIFEHEGLIELVMSKLKSGDIIGDMSIYRDFVANYRSKSKADVSLKEETKA